MFEVLKVSNSTGLEINDMETNRAVIKRKWLRKMFPPYYDEGCFPVNKWSHNKTRRMIYSLEARASKTWKHNRKTQFKET